jgi:hypothetical protein
MTSDALGASQLRRVNAFRGLMIDSGVWRDAHDYHRSLFKLHQLALHGWGIATGLEVTIGQDRDTVTISPGLAVDPHGNYVLVSEPFDHRFQSRTACVLHLALEYSEIASGPWQPRDDQNGQPTRIIEAYRIRQRDHEPASPGIEVCRVDFDPLLGPIRDADDPTNPRKNEIDRRNRQGLTPTDPLHHGLGSEFRATTNLPRINRPSSAAGEPTLPERTGGTTSLVPLTSSSSSRQSRPDRPSRTVPLSVIRHSGRDWNVHTAGIGQLARAASLTGAEVPVVEETLPEAAARAPRIAYLTGSGRLTLSAAEREALAALLNVGTIIVGDGCSSGAGGSSGAREFGRSFIDAVSSTGKMLQAVQRGHPMLESYFLFAQLPPGTGTAGSAVSDANPSSVFYLDGDYGCAWSGGAANQPLARGTIRDAMELGMNLVHHRTS